jgi:hypothetical protein
MSDWIKDMNRCTGPDGKRETEAHKQEPESPLLDTHARFEIFCRYCGASKDWKEQTIPREIHDRMIAEHDKAHVAAAGDIRNLQAALEKQAAENQRLMKCLTGADDAAAEKDAALAELRGYMIALFLL